MTIRRALVVIVAGLVLGSALGWGIGLFRASPSPSPAASPGAAARAVADLRAWDAARAAAWSSGDASALRSLYVAGSRAGRSDVRMLSSYVDRGLTVDGMRTQVFSARVVSAGPLRRVLVVEDRLVGAVAVGEGLWARLPDDGVSTRRVTMRLVEDRWLVDEVFDEPQASPDASTAETSPSAKS